MCSKDLSQNKSISRKLKKNACKNLPTYFKSIYRPNMKRKIVYFQRLAIFIQSCHKIRTHLSRIKKKKKTDIFLGKGVYQICIFFSIYTQNM